MALMFCGDLHRKPDNIEIFLESDVKTLIQLGDFGFIWTKEDLVRNEFLRYFEFQYPEKEILFVPGNHENYEAIFSCPLVTRYGAPMRQITKNCFALERGKVYAVDRKKILSLGGAVSVDKMLRIPHESWWKEEMPSQKEMRKIYDGIDASEKIDYVVSHTAPIQVLYGSRSPICYGKDMAMEMFLQSVFEKLEGKIDKWYFGHWHTSFINEEAGTKFRCFNIAEFIEE